MKNKRIAVITFLMGRIMGNHITVDFDIGEDIFGKDVEIIRE